MERWTNPRIIFAAGEEMPDNDRYLAGYCDGRHVRTAPSTDAFVERPKRPGSSNGLPCGLDQHCASMARPLLGDTAVSCRVIAGLMHAGIQSEEGNETVRTSETTDRPDRCQQADSHNHIDPGDRHQPLCLRAAQRVSR